MAETLTIVGASVRAAAASARRAGFDVVAGDLFADEDLQSLAQTTHVLDYPRGLGEVLSGPQNGAWMYTGAIENEPDLVDEWAGGRRLWGNAGDVLRRVRDPWQVATALQAVGIACPRLAHAPDRLPRDGTWLVKPRRSAGGAHIRPLTGDAETARSSGQYYQQRMRGQSVSAVYLAAHGRSVLCGLTRQLVGTSWLGATGFGYAGSIGPIDCTATARAAWRRIGDALAGELDLRGLFGVDAVRDRAGRIWPVEVNPRLVASVEVLERACGWTAVLDNVRACRDGALAAMPTGQCCCGKAIVYADADIAIGPELAPWIAAQNCGAPWPAVADIPATGQAVRRGWPVLTVLTQGRDQRAVERSLRTLAGQVRRRLQPAAIA